MVQGIPGLAFDATRLDEVCKQLGIALVVAFGSRATGSPPPGPESDLDLGITFVNGRRPDYWECQTALGSVFPDPELDLVFLQRADPLLRWEVMRAAVLIRGDVDEFLELRAYAYRDFIDSADLRALERRLSEKKLAHIQRTLRAAS